MSPGDKEVSQWKPGTAPKFHENPYSEQARTESKGFLARAEFAVGQTRELLPALEINPEEMTIVDLGCGADLFPPYYLLEMSKVELDGHLLSQEQLIGIDVQAQHPFAAGKYTHHRQNLVKMMVDSEVMNDETQVPTELQNW